MSQYGHEVKVITSNGMNLPETVLYLALNLVCVCSRAGVNGRFPGNSRVAELLGGMVMVYCTFSLCASRRR